MNKNRIFLTIVAVVGLSVSSLSFSMNIFKAIRFNDTSKIIEIFKDGAFDINKAIENDDYNAKCDYKGYTPLCLACRFSRPGIVRLLLENGADANKVNENGDSPIYIACNNKNDLEVVRLEVVKLLLEHGVNKDVNLVIGSRGFGSEHYLKGLSLFYWACKLGNMEIVGLLLKNACFTQVCHSSKVQDVRILGEVGVGEDVNKVIDSGDYKGYTPLHIACDRGNPEVVKLLLEHGADKSVNKIIEFGYYKGYTPLHIVCDRGNIGVVKIFLENVFDRNFNKIIIEGYSNIFIAVWLNDLEAIKSLLQQGGSDVNKVIESGIHKGYTPLHSACRYNSIEVVELLLKNGADVNKCSESIYYYTGGEEHFFGPTPLYIACKYGYIAIVDLLLKQKGIDLNKSNYSKGQRCIEFKTPLFIAMKKGNVEIVKLLLAQEGISLNFRFTCLFTAFTSKRESFAIIKLLLEKGVDVNKPFLKDRKDTTPLYVACGRGNPELVKLLLEYGADISDEVINYGDWDFNSEFKLRARLPYDKKTLEYLTLARDLDKAQYKKTFISSKGKDKDAHNLLMKRFIARGGMSGIERMFYYLEKQISGEKRYSKLQDCCVKLQ